MERLSSLVSEIAPRLKITVSGERLLLTHSQDSTRARRPPTDSGPEGATDPFRELANIYHFPIVKLQGSLTVGQSVELHMQEIRGVRGEMRTTARDYGHCEIVGNPAIDAGRGAAILTKTILRGGAFSGGIEWPSCLATESRDDVKYTLLPIFSTARVGTGEKGFFIDEEAFYRLIDEVKQHPIGVIAPSNTNQSLSELHELAMGLMTRLEPGGERDCWFCDLIVEGNGAAWLEGAIG